MIFKSFGGIDAFPICLASQDPDEIVDTVSASPRSSAASTSKTSPRPSALPSRSACAEELDIPVMHDDQHGTAVVMLGALKNALKVVGKPIERRARS